MQNGGKGELHGTFCVWSSMQNGEWAICMELFASGVPCKTGNGRSAWNFLRPEFHAKRDMGDLHGIFHVRSSMQIGIWAICMELFASGVPCKTGEWAICMELFASGVPCKTGNGRSAWNFPRPEFHAKRGMADLHGTFRVRSSMQNGEWLICMEFSTSGVPCKTGVRAICMEPIT